MASTSGRTRIGEYARQRSRTFSIQASSYEFPDLSDYWDGNWLRVSLSVKHPRGGWHSTDPSLLTFEVSELARWFAAIASGESVSPRIDLIEPNLSFELHERDGSRLLRACFELEYRPSWAHARTPSRDLWVEFSLLDVDLRSAADSLRSQLTRFPVKGTPDSVVEDNE